MMRKRYCCVADFRWPKQVHVTPSSVDVLICDDSGQTAQFEFPVAVDKERR